MSMALAVHEECYVVRLREDKSSTPTEETIRRSRELMEQTLPPARVPFRDDPYENIRTQFATL